MTGLKKAIAALVVGATMTSAVASAAEAQRWRGGGPGWNRGYGYGGGWNRGGRGWYGRRGGVSTGAAVGLGLLGLGVGAAIASRPRGYGYYGAPRGGGYGYVAPGYGYGGYDAYYGAPVVDCYIQRTWDPYIGATVQQRICQ